MKYLTQLFSYVHKAGVYNLPELAEYLGLSLREAQDRIEELAELSDLFTFDAKTAKFVTQKSYLPLAKNRIEAALPDAIEGRFVIGTKMITDSTNSDVLDLTPQDSPAIAVAEMQRSGRGRRSKSWLSPLAKNLYFSMRFTFKKAAIQDLSALSIWVGLAALDLLREMGIEAVKMKWPNDLWVHEQKIAGILVESLPVAEGITTIIGIGINNHIDAARNALDNRPTDCETILGVPLDRNQLSAGLGDRFLAICEMIEAGEKTQYRHNLLRLWEQNSALIGRPIRLFSEKEELLGEEIGIDESGALRILDQYGREQKIYSGELSLRPRN